MIEPQGEEKRPSIECVTDGKAFVFRENQFESQSDNIDFLGLKKQEEDRTREGLRQEQLGNAGMQTRTSTGITDLRALGFRTPSEAYELDE